MNKFIAVNKLLLLGFSLVLIVNIFMPFAAPAGQWLMWIGGAMLAVHLIEFVVMRKKTAKPRPLRSDEFCVGYVVRHPLLEATAS